MHENGIHDYLKYVKFGYGRCSDHLAKILEWVIYQEIRP